MTKRAVIYARVSTGKQAQRDLSIPDQLRAGQKYSEEQGWVVVGEYIDAGVSAKTDRRPEFQRMIYEAHHAHTFDVIVVHSFSRYFRNLVEAEIYRYKLGKAGVEVVSITQDFGQGPIADLTRQIVAAFDEYSSKETGKNVSSRMLENARQGFVNGRAPFGYKSVPVDQRGSRTRKTLEIQEEKEKEIIEYMFGLIRNPPPGNDLLGVKSIAQALDEKQYRKRTGKPFSFTDVHHHLTDPVYKGCYTYNRRGADGIKKPEHEQVVIPVPAIIDPDEWQEVQEILHSRDPMKTNVRVTVRPMLLAKVARCDNCTGVMTLGTGKSGQYRYYMCSNANRLSKAGCDKPRRIREDLLDRLVVDHLAEALFEPNRLRVVLEDAIAAERAAQKKAPQELEHYLARKADLDTRIGRMNDWIESGKVEPDDDEFVARRNALRRERQEVEALIGSIRKGSIKFSTLTPAKVQALGEALRSALLEGERKPRNAYMRLFLDRAIVRERQIELRGHKRVLAQAYAADWSPSQGGGVRALAVVPTQVANGAPERSRTPNPQIRSVWLG